MYKYQSRSYKDTKKQCLISYSLFMCTFICLRGLKNLTKKVFELGCLCTLLLFKLAHPLTPSSQSWAPTIEKLSDKRQLTQTIQQTAAESRHPTTRYQQRIQQTTQKQWRKVCCLIFFVAFAQL
jgi:hypothetical protein